MKARTIREDAKIHASVILLKHNHAKDYHPKNLPKSYVEVE